MAEYCEECHIWQRDQMEDGRWDEFTVAQVRTLVATHHRSHDIEAMLDGLADDQMVEVKVHMLRDLVRQAKYRPPAPHLDNLVVDGALELDDEDALAIARDLQPDPPAPPPYEPPPAADGHQHIRSYRQRCVPPEPGFVDEFCACDTLVRPHVACPHRKQVNNNGRVACGDCDYVFVAKSGVVDPQGDMGLGRTIKREEAAWLDTSGGGNRK